MVGIRKNVAPENWREHIKAVTEKGKTALFEVGKESALLMVLRKGWRLANVSRFWHKSRDYPTRLLGEFVDWMDCAQMATCDVIDPNSLGRKACHPRMRWEDTLVKLYGLHWKTEIDPCKKHFPEYISKLEELWQRRLVRDGPKNIHFCEHEVDLIRKKVRVCEPLPDRCEIMCKIVEDDE